MGSAGNQNPWAPYDSYKDCSLGICSVYCPQWCFYVLPPPPPDDDDDSAPTFSPLIIAIIGILASAFLLVTYYTVITKYCRRRGDSSGADLEANSDQTPQDQWQVLAAPSGLDETVIKSITVCKYRKGEGLVEGTECSVCLSDFQDDESLRLLPKCSHAFHLPCIDTWLKSHSNCPLCRANVANPPHQLSGDSSEQNNSALTPPPPSAAEQSDLVLVVDDDHREEGSSGGNGESSERGSSTEKYGDDEEEKGDGVKVKLRRSLSFGGEQRQLILGGSDEKRIDDHQQPHAAFGRSISTGRLMFSRYDDNGKNLF